MIPAAPPLWDRLVIAEVMICLAGPCVIVPAFWTNVFVADLPATIDVKTAAGGVKSGLAKRWPDFHLVEESETTLGGVPALKLVYTYTYKAGLPMLENVQVFAVADKTLYTLSLGTTADQFARFEPTAAAVIQSFEPGEPTAKSAK